MSKFDTKVRYNTIIESRFERSHELTLPAHQSKVHSVKWNIDGSRLASGGADKSARLFLVDTSRGSLELDRSYEEHRGSIDQLCWHQRNENLFATASLDKTVKVWDARATRSCATIHLLGENISVCWSYDGQTIAVADREDNVSFIDVRYHKVKKDQHFKFEVNEITWNHENDLFFLTSGEGNIHVLSYPDLESQLVIDAHSGPCMCIQFDSSGRLFAVGSNDATASIWDSENLACIRTITRPEWPVRAISFSHDSKFLASGSEDTFIDIADVRTGKTAAQWDVKSSTLALDFHPKQYILAFAMDHKDYRDTGSIKVLGFPEYDSLKSSVQQRE